MRYRGFIACLLLTCMVAAPAWGQRLVTNFDTSSARATYQSFLLGMQRIEELYGAYRDDPTLTRQAALGRAMVRLGSQFFDLSQVPAATRMKAGAAAVGYMADILNRLPASAIPPEPGESPPARYAIAGTDLRLVRVDEGARGGEYVFSADTVARLPEIHAEMIGEPLQRPTTIPNWRQLQQRFTGPMLSFLPLSSLPEPLQAPVFGTPAWKLVIGGALVVVVVVVILGWARFIRARSAGVAAWKRHALGLTLPAVMALAIEIAHGFFQWQVNPSGAAADGATILATLAFYAAAAWAAWIFCWFVAEAIIASPRFADDIYDQNLLRLLARVSSLVGAVVLLILGASDVGVPAMGLLAGVSVGGIALALAAQSTVENLFGGVAIFADRPFRVGDEISAPGATGTVISIGPRSSRIRAADGTVMTVPNADMAKSHVTNLALRNRFAFHQSISMSIDTPQAAVMDLLQDLRRRVASEPLVEQGQGWPRVRLVGMTKSDLQIDIAAQVMTGDEGRFLEVQEALILSMMEAVEAARRGQAAAGDTRQASKAAPA